MMKTPFKFYVFGCALMTAASIFAFPISAQVITPADAPTEMQNQNLWFVQSNIPTNRFPGRVTNPNRPGGRGDSGRPDRPNRGGGFRPGFGVIIDLGRVDDEPRRPRRPRREVIIEDESPRPRKKQLRQNAQQDTPKVKQRKVRPVVAKTKKQRQFRENELVILIRKDQSANTESELAKAYNLELLNGSDLPLINARMQRFRIKKKGIDIWQLVQKIGNDKRIISAYPNAIYKVLKDEVKEAVVKDAKDDHSVQQKAVASDQKQDTQKQDNQDMQYALKQLHIAEAHNLARGREVKIAVIDSGIENTHPAFQGAVAARFNAVDGAQNYKGHTHGTAIGGIIAARGQSEKGEVLGIAPEAKLLDARAFFVDEKTKQTETDTFVLLKAMQWAYDQGARVFNMSFAGPRDPALALVIEELQKKDVILIAAVGNAGPKALPAYPAAYKDVIAVTAVDQNEKIYKDANQGSYVSIAAPGVEILVVTPEKSYDYSTGTSMAAAHVSGLVALMLEENPKMNREDVVNILASSARDLGKPGVDPAYGAGLADALKAIQDVAEGENEKAVSQRQDGVR